LSQQLAESKVRLVIYNKEFLKLKMNLEKIELKFYTIVSRRAIELEGINEETE